MNTLLNILKVITFVEFCLVCDLSGHQPLLRPQSRHCCQCASSSTPAWSLTYVVKGVLYTPYAEICEPFAGWYDANAGSSRVDYYGGASSSTPVWWLTHVVNGVLYTPYAEICEPFPGWYDANAGSSREVYNGGESSSTPEWSITYVVKGVLYVPYAEISEPFAGWYDANAGSSRVDYYGGMVKTYQLSTMGKFGTLLKVAPTTTETELNAIKCFEVTGSSDNKIKPQSMIPDLTGFELIGQEEVNGVMADKWRKIDRVGEKVKKSTMYLRWKKSPKSPKEQIPIPVRYEIKGLDHYYLNYEEFTWGAPPSDVFNVGNKTKCGSFSGPAEDHISSFNPIAEFIDSVSHHVDSAWEQYRRIHNKDYQPEEHNKRKETFRQNLRLVASNNRANLGYVLAVNHLADRTPEELKVLRGRRHSSGYNGGLPFPYDTATMANSLPEQFDWRIYGAVTPVKDQFKCGSCWSFGTTGQIEGAYFVKTGHLLRLSQQALVDCSWGEGNDGCDGGWDYEAYRWIMKHGGLPTEGDYGGYMGQDGYCHINQTQLVAPITGYVNVTSNDPDALKIALLKHGPISVAIDASQPTFKFYAHGIYNDKNCSNDEVGLDHAVLLVGYGKIGDKSYWLIKNSWSNYWGNDGYILMDPVNNNCGVMTSPTYVMM